jgi:hypothetical protein
VQELPVEEVIRQLFGQRKITNQANAGRIEISART